MARTPWNKGMKFEYKARPDMRGRFSGVKNSFYGKKHTPETLTKLSEKLKGRTVWNMGTVGLMPAPWNKGTKGIMPIPWNKGKRGYKTIRTPESNVNMRRGESHYLWIKDRSELKDDCKDRGGQLHREWSKSVKNRDGWKCKISNDDCSGRIESHHILGWKEHPELRYQINNGISLCHYHHPRKKDDETRLSPYFQDLVLKAE